MVEIHDGGCWRMVWFRLLMLRRKISFYAGLVDRVNIE